MGEGESFFKALLLVGILCGGIIAICFVLAYISGWSRLASHYRLKGLFKGQRKYFQSGMVGPVSYSFCLTIGVDPNGLYLSILPVFRFGSPPLLIPWTEITHIRRKRGIFGLNAALLYIGEPKVACIRIPWRSIEKALPWIGPTKVSQ